MATAAEASAPRVAFEHMRSYKPSMRCPFCDATSDLGPFACGPHDAWGRVFHCNPNGLCMSAPGCGALSVLTAPAPQADGAVPLEPLAALEASSRRQDAADADDEPPCERIELGTGSGVWDVQLAVRDATARGLLAQRVLTARGERLEISMED
jgi:hypothetical protein